MTKFIFSLFVLLFCGFFITAKAVRTDNTENTKTDDDKDESVSIQVVQRDGVTNKVDNSLIKYDENPQAEGNFTNLLIDTNSTQAEAKYENLFEDLISESVEITLENRNDDTEEVSMPTTVSIEDNTENNSNSQEKNDDVPDDDTKPHNHAEKSQEDSIVNEDENNSRSAENQSGEKKHSNEMAIEESEDERDYSNENYMDKKIDLQAKRRMGTGQPEIRRHFDAKPMNFGQYRPSEDHDSNMRSFGEMMIPRYRPVLTRSGIVFTPTLFPMQTGPSLLDRLTGRNWVQGRINMNSEAETFKSPQSRIVPQYEHPKTIEDYNDYGSNTNTYSYSPIRKVTTQAPPQQVTAPNFDVFQKLMDASNYPKSQRRAFTQMQSPENFGTYNVGRVH